MNARRLIGALSAALALFAGVAVLGDALPRRSNESPNQTVQLASPQAQAEPSVILKPEALPDPRPEPTQSPASTLTSPLVSTTAVTHITSATSPTGSTTAPPTPATTAPPTPATTRPPTPATTAPPPTTAPATTLPPVTATTLPATPRTGFWDIMVRLDPDGTKQGWTARYQRQLSYIANSGWVDGDRVAYRCAYGFLEVGGRLVGRVTFSRIPGAEGYATINDAFMDEGFRYYDGTFEGPGGLVQLDDCPVPDQAYEPYDGSQRPVINYILDGQLAEVRPYTQVDPGPDVTFRLASVTSQRATVIAHFQGLPAVAIYYDSIVPELVMTASA